MGTWHFWCYMREIIEQYCGKDLYKKNGEWITNHFAALISDEDMRSCCYPPEDNIRLWLKREGFSITFAAASSFFSRRWSQQVVLHTTPYLE